MVRATTVNWGRVLGLANSLMCVGVSVGYFFAKDYRRGLYYAGVAFINVVLVW